MSCVDYQFMMNDRMKLPGINICGLTCAMFSWFSFSAISWRSWFTLSVFPASSARALFSLLLVRSRCEKGTSIPQRIFYPQEVLTHSNN